MESASLTAASKDNDDSAASITILPMPPNDPRLDQMSVFLSVVKFNQTTNDIVPLCVNTDLRQRIVQTVTM